jgi:hypothetical protein
MPSLNMKAWPGDGPEAVYKHLQDFDSWSYSQRSISCLRDQRFNRTNNNIVETESSRPWTCHRVVCVCQPFHRIHEFLRGT